MMSAKSIKPGACPRLRSAKTCPPVLRHLELQKRLAAHLGEAWRLPPNREVPPGVPCARRRPWSGLCRSRWESGIRPQSRGGPRSGVGGGLGRGTGSPPVALLSLAPRDQGAWGLTLGPGMTGLRRGPRPETPERPEGEGRSHMCYWTRGCRLFTLAPTIGGLVEVRGPDRSWRPCCLAHMLLHLIT
ncbi:hypothetical protein NDU88_002441 [Pleurodeles waltl]|uniref:Uncharacterized protein n=1 Tax=Pleurodeles waltl TaxID=8319 RepID=A0AAV7WRP4_PLEWA|nr:hypothetical protein NDU88_002441 [Pleurodeles waltl]